MYEPHTDIAADAASATLVEAQEMVLDAAEEAKAILRVRAQSAVAAMHGVAPQWLRPHTNSDKQEEPAQFTLDHLEQLLTDVGGRLSAIALGRKLWSRDAQRLVETIRQITETLVWGQPSSIPDLLVAASTKY